MFQSFDVTTDLKNSRERIKKLRLEMEKLGLDGFLVPRADEHQSEYVPPHAQRLAWLTGFTGSAGMALILKDKAIIFVDGRYTLQVRQQTDSQIFDYEDLIASPPTQWLEKNGANLTIGFDPWLYTIAGVNALKGAVETKANGKLIATNTNLVDTVWHDQPAPPLGQVSIQPLKYAGVEADKKIATMQQDIRAKGGNATILTDPSSIAWTFNIRGHDVSNTPFALSFAIIPDNGRPSLFIDGRKLNDETQKYLNQYCDTFSPDTLVAAIEKLSHKKCVFALDPYLSAEKLRMIIEDNGGTVIAATDPASLPRAIKNTTELEGARQAHLRDGVALCRFFAWLDAAVIGSVSEISAAKKLEEFRVLTAFEMNSNLQDLSFDTISGTGPDGAIIHYRVLTSTDRPLQDGDLYLVDSGGQYKDGTTDVTRTIAIGTVGAEEKRCFTLVLKGMIAISTARFPKKTRGQDIDVLARIALWKAGFDYAHGTGHGVGSYLSVHEGPQNLSKRGTQELHAGMVISNEPGYYRENAFGIRIENLLIVEEAESVLGGDIAMHSFETLTLCPIDRRLINADFLTQEERDWINDYHHRVYAINSFYLHDDNKEWLKSATAAI